MFQSNRFSISYFPASFGLALCLGVGLQASQVVTDNLRPAVDTAIGKVKPALVRIRVVSTEFNEGREIKMQAVGSGAIITKDGYLITNHHVAGHGARMFCTLWNREEIEADLVGTDPLTDISVLKLKPVKPRDRKSTRLNSSHRMPSRMPSSA